MLPHNKLYFKIFEILFQKDCKQKMNLKISCELESDHDQDIEIKIYFSYENYSQVY